MTSLNPATVLHAPPSANDDPASFADGEHVPAAPGVAGSVLFALVTFGVGPLISWPLRFRDFADAERTRLLRLCDWLRLRTGDDARVVALRDDVDGLGVFDTLQWVAWLCAASFTIYLLATLSAFDLPGGRVVATVEATYAAERLHVVRLPSGQGVLVGPAGQLPYSVIERLHRAWLGLVGVGYAAHWLQVRRHAVRVRRAVEQFNGIVAGMNVAPVVAPTVGIGLRPLWALAGAALVAGGVGWGLPFALAGGLQSRAVQTRFVRARHAVAARLGAVARRQTIGACTNPQCRAAIPAGARFCARCGRPLA